jgi:hypothetical protein
VKKKKEMVDPIFECEEMLKNKLLQKNTSKIRRI